VNDIYNAKKQMAQEIARERKRQQEIDAAGSGVHKAAKAYNHAPTQKNGTAYVHALDGLGARVSYDARLRAQGHTDRAGIIKAEIAGVMADYGGTGAEKAVLKAFLDDLQTELLKEKSKEAGYQIHRYEALQAVEKADRRMSRNLHMLKAFGDGPASNPTIADARTAAQEEYNKALKGYSVAVGNLIDLDIGHKVSQMPAGPDGLHSPAQWKKAGEQVKADLHAKGDLADYIETAAVIKGGTEKIQHHLDVILKDPRSLTPAEQGLANKDPVIPAFLKAAGVKLDDPKLSPEMKQAAQNDPIMFGLLQLSDAKIWTSAAPPKHKDDATQLNSGEYLYVTIGGKLQHLTPEQVQMFELGGENAPLLVAHSLLPALGLDKIDGLSALMSGADVVRSHYASKHLTDLMGGANPDGRAAIPFLGTQLSGYFSPEMRRAFWEEVGRPYMEPYLQKGVDGVKPLDEASTLDPYLSALGKYMDGVVGNNAPPEIAGLLADKVMTKVDQYLAKKGSSFDPSNIRFLKGFAATTERADQLPGVTMDQSKSMEGAKWLLKPREGLTLAMVAQDSAALLAQSIGDTGNANLADALLYEMKQRPDEYPAEQVQGFEYAVASGMEKYGLDQQGAILKKQYNDFMAKRDKVLRPFFDELLKDPRIGRDVSVKSDTELHNIIGKTLKLKPVNKDAADKLDYSHEWYKPGTEDWNTIMTTAGWLRNAGLGPDDKLKAIPFKLAAESLGVRNGGIFIITAPDGTQKLVDGAAAKDAVEMNGGKIVASDASQFQWLYDDLTNFREDNFYKGKIFLPTGLNTQDVNGDKHVDYQQMNAAITTGGERLKQVASYAAVAALPLAFMPGLNVIGWTVLAATAAGSIGASIDSLARMNKHKADMGWENISARDHYMNIFGNALGLGRLGIFKLAGNTGTFGRLILTGRAARAATWLGEKAATPWALGTARAMGAGASYVGFTQATSAASMLFAKWDQLSDKEKREGFLFVAAGLASLGLGGIRTEPVARPTLRDLRDVVDDRAQQILQSKGITNPALAERLAGRQIQREVIDWRASVIANRKGLAAADAKIKATERFEKGVNRVLFKNPGMSKVEAQNQVTQAWLNSQTLMPMPLTYRQQLGQWVQAMRNPRQIASDWKGRWQDRGNPWNQKNPTQPRNTSQIRFREYVEQAKATVKTLFKGYVWANGIGAGAWIAWNFGLNEDRAGKAGKITDQNADAELKKLQNDPDGYLDKNYDFEFAAFVDVGDNIQNFNGHLLAVQSEDKPTYYFRRVPRDLYDGLKAAHKTDKVFVTEEVPYNQIAEVIGGQPIGPLDRHYAQAATGLWHGAELDFGQKAYDFWKNAGSPTTADDAYWGTAKKDPQKKIDARARELWTKAGQSGNGPTKAQITQAKKDVEGKIGLDAYERWAKAGRPAGGKVMPYWKQAEPDFQKKVGLPAYEKWVNAGRPDTKKPYWDNVDPKTFVKAIDDGADKLWEKDGRPVPIKVEIRPPYRGEPFRGSYSQTWDTGAAGFRWRPSFALGPIEGLRMHADFETTLNYRYTGDTQTTLRVGAPSPTQGWGVGVRQQDTSYWIRATGSLGAIDLNKSRVVDVTNPGAWWSGREFMIGNGRIYLDVGNRNRLRLDYAGKGTGRGSSSWAHDKTYVRARETGFLEIGLGADFLKYVYDSGEYVSFNGYYELQFYPADLRDQVNLTDSNNGPMTQPGKGPGFQPFPQFEIDPALQLTTTEPGQLFDLPPWLQPENK
jgi:hypothetical protein